MRRVGKGFSRVDIPLFVRMLVPQQVHDDVADDVVDDVADANAKTTPLSPTPATTPPTQQELIPSSSQTCATLTKKVANLKQDKITQAFEITKLKQRARGCIQIGGIAELDADEDVTLEEVAAEVTKDVDVQGKLEESQAQVYHLDLEHAQKVLSIQDDEAEPVELKEVIEVVTTVKLMKEVVIAAATTITAALMPKASTARKRKGVVIIDPEETATPLVIVNFEPKSKDKGKGILVEEPKHLKRQAHIEHDEAYARELEAELNVNINWNEGIEHVKRKEKQDNTVMRYQSLKRKPQTEAHARKNMMVYLKNMVGFKMDFFKGMTYDEIRPIFEKHFNSIVAFLKKGENKLEEEASKQSKRKSETSEENAAKKQKLDKEPKNFSNDFLLNALKTMFEKPDVEASIWKNQRGRYGLAKVKSWKLLESCGVHILTFTTTQMILVVERRYPLMRFTLDQILNNVRLEVEEESEVSLELLRFVKRQQQEGYKPE
nr:hypothetical protein [Tanacetum cinerariifolium]